MPKPIQYGFLQHRDIMSAAITPQLVPVINRAIAATLAEYDRQMNALLGLFAEKTSRFKFKYQTPTAKKLQALDENGRARKTSGVGYYDVAFPLFAAGDAWGANYVTQQKMTVQTVNDWLAGTLAADRAFVAELLLKALFADRSWVYEDPENGALTIQPLANNDDQEYLIRAGFQQGNKDNHLLAQAAEISDAANPFPLIRRELIEHPENGGDAATVIVLTPAERMSAIEGLSGFSEVPDFDIVPALTQAFLGAQLGVPTPGTVRGKVNGVWIVEWPTLPEGHLIAVANGAGGDPALAQREHPEAALQGFFELPVRSDTPYEERQYQRHTGFGGYNRVGALAYQIGQANFVTPAGYEAPVTE